MQTSASGTDRAFNKSDDPVWRSENIHARIALSPNSAAAPDCCAHPRINSAFGRTYARAQLHQLSDDLTKLAAANHDETIRRPSNHLNTA